MKFAEIKEKNAIEQFLKIREELIEVKRAINNRDRGETIAECFDVIQASANMILNIATEEEISTYKKNHHRKLEDRNKKGTIKIERWVEL